MQSYQLFGESVQAPAISDFLEILVNIGLKYVLSSDWDLDWGWGMGLGNGNRKSEMGMEIKSTSDR